MTPIAENVVSMVTAAAVILGLYAMGAGAWSFWGLVFLLNLNIVKRR